MRPKSLRDAAIFSHSENVKIIIHAASRISFQHIFYHLTIESDKGKDRKLPKIILLDHKNNYIRTVFELVVRMSKRFRIYCSL